MNFLAIDYGRKHTGIAIATTPIAQPLKTISTKGAMTQIQKLIDQHKIDQIIVGIAEGKIAQETNTFAHKLRKFTKKPVNFHDETLSSFEAKNKLVHSKKSVRSGPQHHFAAAIILQDFLDKGY